MTNLRLRVLDKMAAAEKADKRPLNEIEAIFADKSKKRKKESSEQGEKQAEGKKQQSKKKKKRKTAKSGSGNLSSASEPRKKTEDGLSVYTEAELGFNKRDAGGTPLCPFDCQCCF